MGSQQVARSPKGTQRTRHTCGTSRGMADTRPQVSDCILDLFQCTAIVQECLAHHRGRTFSLCEKCGAQPERRLRKAPERHSQDWVALLTILGLAEA